MNIKMLFVHIGTGMRKGLVPDPGPIWGLNNKGRESSANQINKWMKTVGIWFKFFNFIWMSILYPKIGYYYLMNRFFRLESSFHRSKTFPKKDRTTPGYLFQYSFCRPCLPGLQSVHHSDWSHQPDSLPTVCVKNVPWLPQIKCHRVCCLAKN